MLCYRDRTFCSFYTGCRHGADCSSALTEAVQKKADDAGLWICQYADKPNCWEGR